MSFNKYASILCWAGSLYSAYLCQQSRDKAAIHIHTVSDAAAADPTTQFDHLTGSFRERFLLPFLPCCIIVWTICYIMICGSVKKCWGKERAMEKVAGYPGWSWMVGLFHGGLILPCLMLMSILAHCSESGEVFMEGQWFTTLFMQGTWGTAESLSRILLEQVHCAVIGYMLKDFCGLYGKDGLEMGFVLHHIGGIAGCSMCLHFPSLVGLVAFNAVQCEFASAWYNLSVLYESTILNAIYVVLMGASNIATVPIGGWVFHGPIEDMYRYGYVVLTVLIVFLRCGGWVVQLKSLCGGRGGGGGAEVKVKVGKQKTKKETKKDK
jgi:hypothetical protein